MTKFPDGWEVKRLSECLEKLESGKKAERGWSPQCLSQPSSDENVWGVLKTTSVQMGDFQPEHNKELPDYLVPKSGLEVHSGDFLVTTTGPRNRCGIVCHVKKTRKKLIFSGKILRFRVNESLILPNWLMYLLMSPEYQSILDKMKVGTSDSSVSIGNQQILDLEIPVPAIDVQHEIVELLEDHLSRLDAALADVKQAKLKAAQFRRSLLQAAFNGNLTGDGSRVMTEWKTQSLKDWEMQAQSGFASGVHNAEGRGVTHLRPMNISRLGKLDLEIVKSVEDDSTRRIIKGDILFNNTNSAELVGKTTIIEIEGDFAFSNHMTRLRFPVEKVNHKYMAMLLHSFWMSGIFNQICSNHVNQASVAIKRLEQVEVALPPLPEQQKIVEILEDHLSRLDASVAIADAMEKQSSSLRRSLLQAAFTGQLTNEVASV